MIIINFVLVVNWIVGYHAHHFLHGSDPFLVNLDFFPLIVSFLRYLNEFFVECHVFFLLRFDICFEIFVVFVIFGPDVILNVFYSVDKLVHQDICFLS